MKLTIMELQDRYIRFEIDGIDYSIANMLRRTLINDIPKLAIKNVIFHLGSIQRIDKDGNEHTYNSSSPLFNEIIAHRLGLIPLPTDLNMKFREDCEHPLDQACPLCTVTYTLTKYGPDTVYSGDLIPVGDSSFAPIEKEIPIVKLNETQALLIDAEAIMGTAKQHARWQVTSGVSYKYHREFLIPKIESDIIEKLKKDCPKNIINESDEGLLITDDIPCKHIASLFRIDGVKIKDDDSRFIFQFETDGSLTAKQTLLYAIHRLKERLSKIRDSITV
ncbi:MAG: DNA-directed RNA polymerase subunit D [Thermoplasmata archaeon]|nr:DNA-directed RNA polymerase subunit D [Thermoplasmata archaeon]